ncbi:hypothetical protein EON83_02310 [bacterium]|nr:MAG: hypothetical protein EON83_02310 [bacterium]
MVEPILELAPHELPPGGDRGMDGKAFFLEASLFNEKRTFIGRSFRDDPYESILCFSVPDEPQRGHFVCAQAIYKGDWVYPKLTHSPDDEYQALAKCIEDELWGRYFVLDANLELTSEVNAVFVLYLCADGRAAVRSPRRGFACFKWSEPCGPQMWETSYQTLLSQIISDIATSDTVGFAFRWANMSRREHFELAYPLQRGTYSEWIRMCDLFLRALDIWTEKEAHKLEFNVSISDGAISANWFPGEAGNYRIARENCFQKFAYWSHHYFSPTLDDELCGRYSCAAEWANGPISVVRGSLNPPTLHERLEARLKLTEWLADKATPEEIEQLLSDD